MPDPLDELENFSTPGLTMTPLPAAEVRRRGTRMRRRNNALATVGAVAAVAIIATPIAVAVNGGNQGGQPLPVDKQPPGGWTTSIPEDFQLGALPAGAQFTFDVQDQGVVDELAPCGEPGFSTSAATDTAGAIWAEPGSDGHTNRTLALYGDADQAQAELDGLRDAVESCPREDQSGNALPLVNAIVDQPVAGAEDALIYTNQAQDGQTLSDMTVFQVVRVGNALFLAGAFGTAGGPQAEDVNIPNLIENSAPVVAQLCTFSIEGCDADDPEASEGIDDPAGLSGTIPEEFPLEKGLPTDRSNGATGVEGPSRDLNLAPYAPDSIEACGVTPSDLPKPVDTVYAGYRSAAYGILRQVMTFESVDEAQAYAEGLVAPYSTCPEETDERGVTALHEVHPANLGDYAASAYKRHEVEGEPGPGYQIVQVVRVGQAVLQTLVNNDGEVFDAEASTMYLENSQTVVDAMD